jgi:hypothetical protein
MLALGLGLTAFFWLPAFLERDLVQIEKTYLPAVFDYRFNFVKLGEVFALPAPVESDPYDELADIVEAHLDMEKVMDIMRFAPSS